VRAEAQVTLLDMLPDGLTRRVDAAERLDLKGPRRQMLTDWGILLQDAGKLDDAKAGRVREALVRLPGARADLELIYAGDDRSGPLHARGLVAFAGGAEASPFGDEVSPTTAPPGTFGIVQDLAVVAAKRAMDNRAELRVQAEHDAAAAAQNDKGRMLGKPRAPSVDHVIGAAAHLLVIDAPRAIDLAFVRVVAAHRPESAALLSDAIGALAAFAIPAATTAGASGLTLELGKGAGAPMTMSAIRLAPNGAAIGFTLDGHAWAIDRAAPSYAVTGITRDGQLLSISQLTTAKTPKK
jgi:hypothetical protein